MLVKPKGGTGRYPPEAKKEKYNLVENKTNKMIVRIKKKSAQRFISLMLAVLLTLNPFLVRVVWAQEAEGTIEGTVVVQADPSPSSDPSPASSSDPVSTPAPDSSVTTGDAGTTAVTETVANVNVDTLPGEVTTGEGACTPPEGQTECPQDVTITNDNTAEVDTGLVAVSETGSSAVSDSSGDATLSTGDATSTGEEKSAVNINTLEMTPSEEGDTSGSDLTVGNTNDGELDNEALVAASTGGNIADSNVGQAAILTGDALAILNLVNLLNINIVGSNFEIFLLDLLNGQLNDLDLNKLWTELLERGGSDRASLSPGSSTENGQIVITNNNDGTLTNNAQVSAATGDNRASGYGGAQVTTGDATALANIANIVNANVYGSDFILALINILGPQSMNLILPRPENFFPQGGTASGGAALIDNQNQAGITDSLLSTATTGGDTTSGNGGGITTGEAQSVANNFTLANLDVFQNNWFFLLINNLGSWSGKIISWQAPGVGQSQSGVSGIYDMGLAGEGGLAGLPGGPMVTNHNQAHLTTNLGVSASTGGNEANGNGGEAEVSSGKARSLGNIFNLVNANLIGGRFFMGVVNILNDWSGNVVFAYPDVQGSLSADNNRVTPGDTFSYTLTVKNQGYDTAGGVVASLTLPEGLEFVGDNSGLSAGVSGRNYSWGLGSLGLGEERNFTVSVRVSPDFSFTAKTSFWSKIVHEAKAAENEKTFEVVATVAVSTQGPETDLNNNSSSATTTVYQPADTSDGIDHRQPVLEISASNNVNGFVYAGDTVTFEIIVKNTSDVASYDTRLTQKLYNHIPGDFGVAEFNLGTVEAGKSGKLSFGLKLSEGGVLPEGPYHTLAQAFGKSGDGKDISSNESRTDFNLKYHLSLIEPKAVLAAGKEEVLGASPTCPQPEEDILPYVLLLVFSTQYLSTWSRRKLMVK